MMSTLFAELLALMLPPASPAVPADPVRQVRCAEIAFSLSLQNKDRETFASLIDEDARFVGDGFKVTQGRGNITEAWSGLFAEDAPDMIWRPQVVSVLDSGDIALSRGPYRIAGTLENGESYENWGIFNSVWRLGGDGEWRVVFDAGFPASGPLPDASRSLIENPAPACAGDH